MIVVRKRPTGSLTALAVIAVFALLLTAPLLAAGNWSGTFVMDDDPLTIDRHKVVMDSNGNTLIVWENYDGSARKLMARLCSGEVWGNVITLVPSGLISDYWDVAMDSTGMAVVAYAKSVTPQQIYVKTYHNGQEFSGETKVSDLTAGQEVARFQVRAAMDGNGRALVAWSQGNDSDMAVYYSRYAYTSGSWQWSAALPALVVTPTGIASGLELTSCADGRIAMTWVQNKVVQMTFMNRAGALSEVVTISDSAYYGPTMLSLNQDLDGALVFQSDVSGDYYVVVQAIRAGLQVGDPIVMDGISRTLTRYYQPLALPDGRTWVINTDRIDASSGYRKVIASELIVSDAGNVLTSPITISSHDLGEVVRSLDGAVAPNGTALITWQQFTDTSKVESQVFVVRYANGEFQAAQVLDSMAQAAPSTSTGGPALAMDALGNAGIFWRTPRSDDASKMDLTCKWMRADDRWNALRTGSDANTNVGAITESNGRGDAVTVWTRTENDVQVLYASRLAGNAWSPAVRLQGLDPTTSAAYYSLAVNSEGDARVVYLQTASGIVREMWTAAMVGGVWGTAVKLGEFDMTTIERPLISMDRYGRSLVSWVEHDSGGVKSVWAGEIGPAGLTGISQLDGGVTDVAPSQLSMGMDDAGNAVVTWIGTPVSGNNTILAAYRGPTGWSASPLIIEERTRTYTWNSVVMSDEGRAVAVFAYFLSGAIISQYVLRTSTFSDGSWSDAQLVISRSANPLAMVSDGQGRSMLIWQDERAYSQDSMTSVYAAWHDAGTGLWDAGRDASYLISRTDRTKVLSAKASISPGGDAAVVLTMNNRYMGNRDLTYASLCHNGVWGPTTLTYDRYTWGQQLSGVSIDERGGATMVWLSGTIADGGGNILRGQLLFRQFARESAPALSASIFDNGDGTARIEGIVDREAQVYLDGVQLLTQQQGFMVNGLRLLGGENTFELVAVGWNGRCSMVTLTLHYTEPVDEMAQRLQELEQAMEQAWTDLELWMNQTVAAIDNVTAVMGAMQDLIDASMATGNLTEGQIAALTSLLNMTAGDLDGIMASIASLQAWMGNITSDGNLTVEDLATLRLDLDSALDALANMLADLETTQSDLEAANAELAALRSSVGGTSEERDDTLAIAALIAALVGIAMAGAVLFLMLRKRP